MTATSTALSGLPTGSEVGELLEGLLDRVVLMSAPGPVHISIWKV